MKEENQNTPPHLLEGFQRRISNFEKITQKSSEISFKSNIASSFKDIF